MTVACFRLVFPSREGKVNYKEFFEQKNQKSAPSLSQNGLLNTGVKSQLMPILETGQVLPNSVPIAESLVPHKSIQNSRDEVEPLITTCMLLTLSFLTLLLLHKAING